MTWISHAHNSMKQPFSPTTSHCMEQSTWCCHIQLDIFCINIPNYYMYISVSDCLKRTQIIFITIKTFCPTIFSLPSLTDSFSAQWMKGPWPCTSDLSRLHPLHCPLDPPSAATRKCQCCDKNKNNSKH